MSHHRRSTSPEEQQLIDQVKTALRVIGQVWNPDVDSLSYPDYTCPLQHRKLNVLSPATAPLRTSERCNSYFAFLCHQIGIKHVNQMDDTYRICEILQNPEHSNHARLPAFLRDPAFLLSQEELFMETTARARSVSASETSSLRDRVHELEREAHDNSHPETSREFNIPSGAAPCTPQQLPRVDSNTDALVTFMSQQLSQQRSFEANTLNVMMEFMNQGFRTLNSHSAEPTAKTTPSATGPLPREHVKSLLTLWDDLGKLSLLTSQKLALHTKLTYDLNYPPTTPLPADEQQRVTTMLHTELVKAHNSGSLPNHLRVAELDLLKKLIPEKRFKDLRAKSTSSPVQYRPFTWNTGTSGGSSSSGGAPRSRQPFRGGGRGPRQYAYRSPSGSSGSQEEGHRDHQQQQKSTPSRRGKRGGTH